MISDEITVILRENMFSACFEISHASHLAGGCSDNNMKQTANVCIFMAEVIFGRVKKV